MRILMVNRALGTLFGGGESFDLNAAKHLAHRGHEVTLLTGKPLWGKPLLAYEGVKVEYVPSPDLRRFAYRMPNGLSAPLRHLDEYLFEGAAFDWIKSQGPDRFDLVSHCYLFRLPQKLLRTWGLPVVSWLPGPPNGTVRRALKGLMKEPLFGLFTHGSPQWALEKMGFHEGKDFRIIEPGVDLGLLDKPRPDRDQVRDRLGVPKDTHLGVTTARLIPIKDHSFLLRGIAKAVAQGTDLHWALIGGGPLEGKLWQEAKSLGLEGRVHFLGAQGQERVREVLGASDLFALTSSYENFSIATLEAMAQKLPVVATEVGYLGKLVKDAGAGLLVPSGDVPRLAQALQTLTGDRALSRGSGEKGRAFVERLDWPLIAGKLETLFKGLVERKGK